MGHLTLHTEVAGRESPATLSVVLLHGFTNHNGAWQQIAEDLQQEFRVILIDLPGHGRSPAPDGDYTFNNCVQDVLRTIDTLCQDSSPDLIGYSMGGRIALGVALQARHRIRKLVLESASPGIEAVKSRAERRRRDHELAKRIEAITLASFIDEWERMPLFATQRRPECSSTGASAHDQVTE